MPAATTPTVALTVLSTQNPIISLPASRRLAPVVAIELENTATGASLKGSEDLAPLADALARLLLSAWQRARHAEAPV